MLVDMETKPDCFSVVFNADSWKDNIMLPVVKPDNNVESNVNGVKFPFTVTKTFPIVWPNKKYKRLPRKLKKQMKKGNTITVNMVYRNEYEFSIYKHLERWRKLIDEQVKHNK